VAFERDVRERTGVPVMGCISVTVAKDRHRNAWFYGGLHVLKGVPGDWHLFVVTATW